MQICWILSGNEINVLWMLLILFLLVRMYVCNWRCPIHWANPELNERTILIQFAELPNTHRVYSKSKNKMKTLLFKSLTFWLISNSVTPGTEKDHEYRDFWYFSLHNFLILFSTCLNIINYTKQKDLNS